MEEQIYHKKAVALKKLDPGQILCNRDLTKYFILKDHHQFAEYIENENPLNRNFYEYIPNNVPVPLYFDIEIYKDSEYFDNNEYLLQLLFDKIKTNFIDKL